MKLTQERLKELLSYDPDTGEFHWLKDGKLAGSNAVNGYRHICVSRKIYKAHRLAWLYVYGYFPENGLDHIDRVRNNNRILNLREASLSCNMRNAKGYSSSGVKGVSQRGKNWVAQITVGGKNINLGIFPTKLGAAKARVEAEERYDFITCDRLSEAQIFVNSQPPEENSSRLTRKKPIKQSGIVGITWSKCRNKWHTRIKQTHLGYYDTIQEAVEVIQKEIICG